MINATRCALESVGALTPTVARGGAGRGPEAQGNIHSFHRGGGQRVSENEDGRVEQSATGSEETPPGEFVSTDLETDCARFLEELRLRVARSEGNRKPSGT